MNEKQAEEAMRKNQIDNYAVDPKTGKVTVKQDSKRPGMGSWGTGPSDVE
jgi:hypothetical protein